MKKLITIAACLILITVTAALLFKSGVFENNIQIVRLDDGKIIKFYETNDIVPSDEVPDWYMYDDLADAELKTLFKELPISTAIGAFNTRENNNMVGVEGKINNVGFSISPHMQLVDIYEIGKEKASAVKAIPVVAGYSRFVNGNDFEVTTYYAIFKLGENTYYLDKYVYGDDRKELETARKDIAKAIESMIDNGGIDFSKIKR